MFCRNADSRSDQLPIEEHKNGEADSCPSGEHARRKYERGIGQKKPAAHIGRVCGKRRQPKIQRPIAEDEIGIGFLPLCRKKRDEQRKAK